MERKVVKRRFLSLMLALCMVMTMMPLPAYAENGTGDFIVTGGTLGTDYTYENNVLTIKKGTALTIKNSNPNVATTVDRITVDKNVSANITLAGVNIDLSSSEDGCAFLIAKDSSGTVNLTLADNTKNILKSGKKSAGLQKEGSTGRLVIGCEHSSESNHACTATCGKIEASSEAGAGIGSAYSDKNSEKVHIIQILGGTIIAKSQEGAGIGSGRSLNTSGNVDGIGILGGIVTAESSNGYGIGSGSSLESQGMTSEIGIVSNNTSLKASSLGVTPRNIKGNQIFLMTIHNPNNEPVKIDGVDWKVVNHKAADGKDCNLYAYVDVDVVENEDFEVKVGNNTFFKKLDDSTYTFVDTVGLFSSTGEFKNLYDTPQKVVNAAEPGDIVKLLSNVDINETIKVSKKLTIDLNGYVLKMNSEIYGGFASGSVIEVDDGGDLRIIDSNKTVPHYSTKIAMAYGYGTAWLLKLEQIKRQLTVV